MYEGAIVALLDLPSNIWNLMWLEVLNGIRESFDVDNDKGDIIPLRNKLSLNFTFLLVVLYVKPRMVQMSGKKYLHVCCLNF